MGNTKITFEAEIKLNEKEVSNKIDKIDKQINNLKTSMGQIQRSNKGSSDIAQGLLKDMRSAVSELQKIRQEYTTVLDSMSKRKIDDSKILDYVKTMNSQYDSLSQRVTDLEKVTTEAVKGINGIKFDTFEQRIKTLETYIDGLKGKIDGAISTLSQFNQMINASNTKPKEIKVNVDKSEYKKVRDLANLLNTNLLNGESTLNIRTDTAAKQLTDLYKQYQNFSTLLQNTKDPKEINNLEIQISELLPQMADLVNRIVQVKKLDLTELGNNTSKTFSIGSIKDFNVFFSKLSSLIEQQASKMINLRDTIRNNIKQGVEQASTEVSQFTFKNGGIRVPVTVDASSASALQTKYNEIVKALQEYADKHPVNVTMRLFPLNTNRADATEITNELKRIQTDINNVDDAELKTKLNSLYDDLEAQFKKALNLKIKVDLGETESSAKQRIKELEEAVRQQGFTIYPKFEISDEDADAISKKLSELQEKITLKVTSEVKTMSDSLKDLFDNTKPEEWLKSFSSGLDDIQQKLNSIVPLINQLTGVNTAKSKSKTKEAIPDQQDVNILVEFTNAMKTLRESLQNQQNTKINIDIQPIMEKLEILKATMVMVHSGIGNLQSTLANVKNTGGLQLIYEVLQKIENIIGEINKGTIKINVDNDSEINVDQFINSIQEKINASGRNVKVNVSPNINNIDNFISELEKAINSNNTNLKLNNSSISLKNNEYLMNALQDKDNANRLYINIFERLKKLIPTIKEELTKEISIGLVNGLRQGVDSAPDILRTIAEKSKYKDTILGLADSKDISSYFQEVLNEVVGLFKKSLNISDDLVNFIQEIQSKIDASGIKVKIPITVNESSITTFLDEIQTIFKNGYWSKFSSIINDAINSDKLINSRGGDLFERGFYFNSNNGKHTPTYVYGNEASFSPNITGIKNNSRKFNTFFHSHPNRLYSNMSVGDSLDKNGMGDLLMFYKDYIEHGIETQIIGGKNKSQVFNAKAFFDKYKDKFELPNIKETLNEIQELAMSKYFDSYTKEDFQIDERPIQDIYAKLFKQKLGITDFGKYSDYIDTKELQNRFGENTPKVQVPIEPSFNPLDFISAITKLIGDNPIQVAITPIISKNNSLAKGLNTEANLESEIEKTNELSVAQENLVNQMEKVDQERADDQTNQVTAESAKLTSEEAKAMAELFDKAIKAAEAKKEFAGANKEVLESIIKSLSALNSEGDGFKNLNNLINKLSNVDKMDGLVNNLKELRKALNSKTNENSFVNAIRDIAKQGDSLKNLATVLKASQAEITKAKSVVETKSTKDENVKARIETINQLNKLYAWQAKNQEKYSTNDPRMEDRTNQIRQLEEYLAELEKVELTEEQLAQVEQSTSKTAQELRDAEAQAAENSAKREQKANEEAERSRRKKAEEAEKAAEREERAETRLENRRSDLLKRIGKLQGQGQVNKIYGGELKELENTLNNLPAETNAADKAMTTIYQRLAQIEGQAQATGKTGKSLMQMFSARWKSLAAYLGTFASFYRIVGYIRQAFSTLIDLDTQLVDLRKTTSMTTSELNQFYTSSSDVAKGLGVTTSEIISQAAAWSRLGYSTKEASTEMAKLSSKFASVSPGMTTENATDYLVSTMQAYGIAVDDVERKVMDNVNRIGNTFATTNAEIGEMLTRSSAAMNAANNSLEETIALESAAVEVTRNAEMTGTAFRTVSMRMELNSSPPIW